MIEITLVDGEKINVRNVDVDDLIDVWDRGLKDNRVIRIAGTAYNPNHIIKIKRVSN